MEIKKGDVYLTKIGNIVKVESHHFGTYWNCKAFSGKDGYYYSVVTICENDMAKKLDPSVWDKAKKLLDMHKAAIKALIKTTTTDVSSKTANH